MHKEGTRAEVSTKDEPEVIRVSRNDGNNFNNVSPVRQNR